MNEQSPQLNKDFDDFQFNRSLDISQAHSPDRPLRPEDLSTIRSDTRNSSHARRARQEGNNIGIYPYLEKQRAIREAEEEYKELLRQLDEDENVTAEDIENFKKTALIQKSVQEVRRRAEELRQIRGSPERYRQVKSKIAQNMKTQINVNSSKFGFTLQNESVFMGSMGSPTNTMNRSQFGQTKSILNLPEKRENGFDITQEEYERVKQNQVLSDTSQRKIFDRDQQIRQCEEYLQSLLQDLNDRRPIHEKLESFKNRNNQQQNSDQTSQLQTPQQVVEKSPAPKSIVNGKSPEKAPAPQQQKVVKKGQEKVGMRPGGKHGAQLEAKKLEEQAQVQEQVQQPTQMTVKKQTQNKTEMRPGGTHGKKLEEKKQQQQQVEEQVAQVFQVEKKDQNKTEMRPGGKFGKQLEQKKQQQQDEEALDDKNVLNIKESNDGKRIDLSPPEGANGCVMFIESRSQSQERKQQQQEVFQVKKKQGGVQAGFGKVITQSQPPAEIFNKKEEPKVAEKQVEKQIIEEEEKEVFERAESIQSEEISEDNFGRLATKESKKIEEYGKFSNQDLASKTAQIQEEFEKVLDELNKRRSNRDGGAFYTAINEFYQEGSGTHQSPVRRLIQQKNTTVDHKQTIKESNIQGDYKFVYTTGPQKSYVIEPHGGELNYKLAQKDPVKFYDQVFNQDITKHTVAQDKDVKKQIEEENQKRASQGQRPLKKSQTKVPVTVKSKVTKRPHHKIMDKLRAKIAQKLQEKMADMGFGTILTALKDKPVAEQIKELVKQDKIQILDQQNNIIFENEIKEEFGVPAPKRKNSHQLSSAKKNMADDDKSSDVNLNLDGIQGEFDGQIDANGQTHTHLKIADKDLKKIENKVRDQVKRTNSFKN